MVLFLFLEEPGDIPGVGEVVPEVGMVSVGCRYDGSDDIDCRIAADAGNLTNSLVHRVLHQIATLPAEIRDISLFLEISNSFFAPPCSQRPPESLINAA